MPTPCNAIATIEAELAAIHAAGLYRRPRHIDGPQSTELLVDGKPALNFCSNNYLGLADHPLLREAASHAAAAHGFGAGASRLINGNLAPHRALEARIAAWKGTEAALLFNSGYHANLGLVSALAGPEDAVFSDALNHASLIDGCRLSRAKIVVFPHGDLASLARELASHRAHRRRLILSDAVFSMDGDRAPIADLLALTQSHDALLILDEAHCAGLVELPDAVRSHVRMGTLGKALGAFGAYVAGPRPVIELLINRARSFIFTTALPVPVVAAAHAAIDWLDSQEGRSRRAQLAENCRYFHQQLGLPGEPSHIVPLRVAGGDPQRAMDVCDVLLARGIFAQGIRPPTVPAGTARIRFALMATHTRSHLDRALEAIRELRPYFC